MRSTTAAQPRAVTVTAVIAAAFLATAALLASSAVVRAGIIPICWLLVSSESSPVPAETATAYVGEVGQITGSGFSPDTELVGEVTVNGTSSGPFPIMTDGTGGFVLGGPVAPEQLGTLVFTATELDGCSDSVTVTVLAAPAATPEGLPNAAMEPVAPTPASSGGAALAFASLLALGLVLSAVLELRYRYKTYR